MEILYDETYSSEGEKYASRNIWYGYADISVDGEYAKDICLTDEFSEQLVRLIKNDLSRPNPAPTITNWYFYGKDTSEDAIGDKVRPTVMVREMEGVFVVNINLSDHDFALHIDEMLEFKAGLENKLLNTL